MKPSWYARRKTAVKIAIALILITVLALCAVASYVSTRPVCDLCKDPMFEKPFRIGNYRLCSECYYDLNGGTELVFGNKYSVERTRWIKEILDKM